MTTIDTTPSAPIDRTRTKLNVVGDDVTVLVDGDATGGAFEYFEVEGPEGSGPPPHSHPWTEAFRVMSGEVAVWCGDTETTARPGDVVLVPAGTLHRYEVRSARASFLVVTAGAGASKLFRDLDANVPHGTPTPDTMPTLITVARRNGLSSPLFD